MTKTGTIYVALLDEGVSVWRPAPAVHVEGNRYILLRPDDYDPQDEHWQYPPGTVVECEVQADDDEEHLRAIGRASLAAQSA